jgi:L,D-transpeptidase catalytic domain/Putative peptidoglycan binding domain
MRRAAIPLAALGALAASSSAHAALLPTPPPAQAPAPAPKAGAVSIRVLGGQATKRLRYVARGARVSVRGLVRPYVAGQQVTLEVLRGGRVAALKVAPIRPGGQVAVAFRIRRRGVTRLRLRHAATLQQAAFVSRTVALKAVSLSAGQGARGRRVLILQRALRDLGFAVPVTGFYDAGTSRAVLAFRKTNGFSRDGYASRRVYALALRGGGAFRPRFPRAGRHVEFDWSRQVLVLVRGGRARRVYHASSGKASTPTVFGTFSFYRKDFGTNGVGMVHSNYFIGGYAIHGYHSVPSYPASHGCVRVPIPNALEVFRSIRLGERIFVYG